MTLEELREEIERRRDEAEKNHARWATAFEIAKAELRAHDAAVEAGQLRDYPGHAPLGPDNLNGGRASRRNIPETVYGMLDYDAPLTAEELMDAVGGVKISQIQGALLKLGDKVTTKPTDRFGAKVPGYVRQQEPEHE